MDTPEYAVGVGNLNCKPGVTLMTDAEKWRRLGDGLSLDAEMFDMVGKYDLTRERYKAASEAYQHAREAEAKEKTCLTTK